jgi:hypothetical protein
MRPLAAILLGLLLLSSASAQATLPALPYWACGPGEPMSCYAEGLSDPPAVVVEGGAGGLSNCEDDGSGVTFRCVLWAQGAWTRVAADGVTVAARCPCRVYMGVVSTR